MDYGLTGKRALVTGGSRGIGQATAQALVAEGCSVAICSRSAEQLRAAVFATPDTAKGCRDRALLLLGFAAALRRSELVAINVDDISIGDEGLTLTLRRRKTDQEGAGSKIGVVFGANRLRCPVRAVERWMAAAGIDDGPLFRPVSKGGAVGTGLGFRTRTVARTVKAAMAGSAPTRRNSPGIVLRAGLATSRLQARAGAEERHIMRQTGRRSGRPCGATSAGAAGDNVRAKVGL